MPQILYKYRDWSNEFHKRVLTENEIYFASPKEFNDPFDCAIPFSYDKKDLTEENLFRKYTELARKQFPKKTEQEIHAIAFEQQRLKLIFDEHHIEEQNKNRQTHFNQTFTIFSLSEIKDNFLMWSHYSASHSGFCVGYNTQKLFDQAQGSLGEVKYSEEFPTFGLFDDTITHFFKFTQYKSKIWEYEKEYRIRRDLKKGKTLTLTDDTIEEIVFGYRMKQDVKFDLLKIIEDKYPKAVVYDSKTHKTKFEIVLDRIR